MQRYTYFITHAIPQRPKLKDLRIFNYHQWIKHRSPPVFPEKKELKSTKKDATSKGDVSVVSIHLLPYPAVLSNLGETESGIGFWSYTLISTSTPEGSSSFISASTVLAVEL